MTPDQNRLAAHHTSEEFIFSKLQFLVDIHLWPLRTRLDPYAWIENFTDTERPYALNILNVFLYFVGDLIDAMFRAAVHSLCPELTAKATSLAEARAIWHMFLSTVRVTYVQGERPRPTDSGILFARKARQVLGIQEDHITDPGHALASLFNCPSTPVVFVDDFVGSGNQMISTWTRRYDTNSGYETSFADTSHNSYVVYVPLVATQVGIEALSRECPNLRVCPAHSIDGHYSLVSPDSVLWPDQLRKLAPEVLYNASRRAGIVDGCEFGWKGFHDLALAIAFEHSVPDATLPLIFWDRSGWRPLIRRT